MRKLASPYFTETFTPLSHLSVLLLGSITLRSVSNGFLLWDDPDQDQTEESLSRVDSSVPLMHHDPKPSNQLSSRTSRSSRHKHCRVDNEFCRVEKCISLGRQGPKAISCRDKLGQH